MKSSAKGHFTPVDDEKVANRTMRQELSGVTVVIIIAMGVLLFILLFIFAKRQIMRFALRSRRGPHVPIGHDAKKVDFSLTLLMFNKRIFFNSFNYYKKLMETKYFQYLKREIEQRIDLIPRIICEPQLLSKTDPRYIVCPGQQIPAHYYRLKAVEDVKLLEREITRQDSCLVRHPSENLRAYLLTTLAAPLNGSGQRLIHQFCDLYEHARHDPSHFGDEEYQAYNRLLMKLIDA